MVESQLQPIDRVFHALAHPVRRKILSRLARQESTISELAGPFQMSLEAVSKHITVLERAQLLRRTRHGRAYSCRLRSDPLHQAAKVLAQLTGMWNQRLDALEQMLAVDAAMTEPKP
jgi:DNA-binding transcriptional ArsR family regulator